MARTVVKRLVRSSQTSNGCYGRMVRLVRRHLGLKGRVEAALSFCSDLSTRALLTRSIWINTGRLLLAQTNDVPPKLDVYNIPTCPSQL
jgi:hypothetical protein